jgi:hypothetical protein
MCSVHRRAILIACSQKQVRFRSTERSIGHGKHEHGQRIRNSTAEEPPRSARLRCCIGSRCCSNVWSGRHRTGCAQRTASGPPGRSTPPVDGSPAVYRVTGGLVGTYKLQSERAINAWTYWTTQIRYIEGTESVTGCVDQNKNQSCDRGEPSGELRLNFSRVASFDTATGRLIESRSFRRASNSSGSFSGGLLTMRDIPVGGSDEIVSTYQGDLELTETAVDSTRENSENRSQPRREKRSRLKADSRL